MAPRRKRVRRTDLPEGSPLVTAQACDNVEYHDGGFRSFRYNGTEYIQAHHRHAEEVFRTYFEKLPGYHAESLYVPVDEAVTVLSEIEDDARSGKTVGVYTLVQWLERARLVRDPAAMHRIQKERLASYWELDLAYPAGMPVVVSGELQFGGTVESVEFTTSFSGPYAEIVVRVVTIGDDNLPVERWVKQRVRYFQGMQPLDKLPVTPLTEDAKARLHARGAHFARHWQLGFLSYRGLLRVPGWFGDSLFRGDGRVIIDMESLEYFSPQLAESMRGAFVHRHDESEEDALELTEEHYWRVWPRVPAFSLAVKQWGLIDITGIGEIQFRDDAFDLLVLDPEIKHVVYSIVKHSGAAFADLIDGKSGGRIFLLAGSTGTGKTLTAEAVAEVLQRPLYAVSVGELGTDPRQLEESLRRILDMASKWDAVLLLDEADIFLEERNEHDVLRNAMVGVFLRLLEYHNGVLFLTTNRAKNLDPAVLSRVSVAIHYPDLDEAARTRVFANLFEKAGAAVDGTAFSRRNLNGRQIKNALRIAQTLASAENGPVTEQHVERVLQLSQDFRARLQPPRVRLSTKLYNFIMTM